MNKQIDNQLSGIKNLISRDKYTEAIQRLEYLRVLAPNAPSITLLLGNALHYAGNLAEAAHCFKQVLPLEPFREQALWGLNRIQFEQRLLASRKFEIQPAAEQTPEHEQRLPASSDNADSTHSLTIACLKWGSWGEKHAADYVNRLYSTVQRHLSLPHRFVCFTDNARGIRKEVDILPMDIPEWRWNLRKMILYKPGNGLTGRVMVFDLDTIIVGSIDEICSYKGNYCALRDFHFSFRPSGGVLGFPAGIGEKELWQPLLSDYSEIEEETQGSERFYLMRQLRSMDYWQDLFPGQIVSYKKHCRQGVPPDARVICFHGDPRPHEAPDPWVKIHWH